MRTAAIETYIRKAFQIATSIYSRGRLLHAKLKNCYEKMHEIKLLFCFQKYGVDNETEIHALVV